MTSPTAPNARRPCLACGEPLVAVGGVAKVHPACRERYRAGLTEQRCADCTAVKPLRAFGLDRNALSGRHHYCRACATRRNTAYRNGAQPAVPGLVVQRVCVCGHTYWSLAAARRWFCRRECQRLARELIVGTLVDVWRGR